MSLFDDLSPSESSSPDKTTKWRRGDRVRYFNGAQARHARIVEPLGGGRYEIIYRSGFGQKRVVADEDQLFSPQSKLGTVRRA